MVRPSRSGCTSSTAARSNPIPRATALTKEDVGTTQLSVAAYLIVHPKGVLLWDTRRRARRGVEADRAVRSAAARAPGWSGAPGHHSLVAQAQLAASGYSPRDVTHLALSHYHWDHTANANAFAGATWLVRQSERDAMFADKPARHVRRRRPTAR